MPTITCPEVGCDAETEVEIPDEEEIAKVDAYSTRSGLQNQQKTCPDGHQFYVHY